MTFATLENKHVYILEQQSNLNSFYLCVQSRQEFGSTATYCLKNHESFLISLQCSDITLYNKIYT